MRKLYLLLGGVLFIALQGMAQHNVSGRVMDDKSNPVPNASVIVKGTTIGTTTKTDGGFSIIVPKNARALIFSSVNFTTVEIIIGNQTEINVTLNPEDKTMAEVVVTGYGTQRRKDVTASISSVKGVTIADKPIQSFDQALAGRATGVMITIPNGVLNTPPVFRIRGTNSLSLSSYPLIVVDGIPTFTGDASGTDAAGNALASINPADIESIDIAKDAAGTAIYGSRAANGIVFITTKKGKAGKVRVNYTGSVSWTNVYGLPHVMNAQQYTEYKNMAAANNPGVNSTNPLGSGYTHFSLTNDANGKPINTDWENLIYQQGFSQNHDLSVSGGTDATTYYFSMGYTKQQGIVRTNALVRTNVLANVDSRVNNVLTVGGKIAYSNEQNNIATGTGSLAGQAFNTNGLGRIAVVNAPNVSPYNNDGTYNLAPGSTNAVGSMSNSVTVGFYNPVVLFDKNRSNSESNHMQGNAYIQLKPIPSVTLKSLYGLDYLFVDNEVFQTPIHGDGFTPGGNASSTEAKIKRWTWSNTAQFDYTFASRHNVTALIGNEQDRRTTRGFGLNRQTLSDPVYTVIQAGFTTPNTAGLSYGENYLLSAFGRLNYDYNKKYFLSANLRQDQYSAFVDKRIFWGASGGWEVAKEGFWQTSHLSNIFSSFKLRGSYGVVGNTAGIGDYAIFSTYSSGLYGGLPTLIYSQAGNKNLKWETSSKIDVGVNFGLFKDRILVEATRYYNDIKGLILSVQQAPSAGVPTSVPQNVGTMYNKGFEFSVSGTPIRSRDFSWNTLFTLTTNKNEVTSLAPGLTEVLSSTSGLETVSRTAVGYSAGYLYLVRNGGVDPASGRRILLTKDGTPIMYQFYVPAGQFQWTKMDGTRYNKADGSANTVNQAADGMMVGNTNPRKFGGWDNTFRYKDFELNVQLTYEFQFFVYYGSHAGLHDQRFWNNEVDVLNAWKKPGDVTTVPKPVYGDNISNGSGLPMDYNMFKGDFVKLKNVGISYYVPAKILNRAKINSLRFYLIGQNMAIFTKYPGPDPEVSSNGAGSNTAQGIDRNTIANGRVIVFGLQLGF